MFGVVAPKSVSVTQMVKDCEPVPVLGAVTLKEEKSRLGVAAVPESVELVFKVSTHPAKLVETDSKPVIVGIESTMVPAV